MTAFARRRAVCAAILALASQAAPAQWKPLFDSASLQGWRETPFSGHGKVRVEDGALRLRVSGDRIQAWIDEQLAIDAYVGNREVSLRPGEIELSRPFGIASYSTTAKLRKLESRLIPPPGNRR